MNQESKSSRRFTPRGRRSRRGPRRIGSPPAGGQSVPESSQHDGPPASTIEDTTAPAEAGGETSPLVEEARATDTDVALSEGSSSEAAPIKAAESVETSEQSPEPPRRLSHERPQHFQQRPALPARKLHSLREASREVLAMIEQLNDLLCDFEEVSKLLDDVEVQQQSDEKEIESLRNALRQFQHPPRARHEGHRDRERDRDRDRGRGGGQQRGQERHRDRSQEQRHHAAEESRPVQPPPENRPESPKAQAAPEDPAPPAETTTTQEGLGSEF